MTSSITPQAPNVRILNRNPTKVYDTGTPSLTSYTLRIDDFEILINLRELLPLEDIDNLYGLETAGCIASILDFKITTFQEFPIYNGSIKGAYLYYYKLEEPDQIAIFSMGETQPTRYICKYEALLSIN